MFFFLYFVVKLGEISDWDAKAVVSETDTCFLSPNFIIFNITNHQISYYILKAIFPFDTFLFVLNFKQTSKFQILQNLKKH